MLRIFTKQRTLFKNSSRALSTKLDDHRLKHPDRQDIKEQKMFDENQAKLEKLEHDKNYKNFTKDSIKNLQKRGDDARIEQNRPDDGVY